VGIDSGAIGAYRPGMSSNVLGQVDVERYRAEGYAIVRSVVPAADLPRYREASDEVLGLCSREAERYSARIEWEADHLADPTGMERVIRKLEPVIDLSPAFEELGRASAATEPVEAVLGGGAVLFEDKLNLKLPGGSPYPWHQDWVCCWQAHSDELVTCFIYLDDADAENGCLQVVPCSHRGKPRLPFKGGGHFEVDPGQVPQERIVPVPLAAGDMILFDPYLLHYSDLNRSRSPRRCIIYTYNPAELGRINEQRFPPDFA
jgi:ectoine hydroxylase-related dioxygenase (phytanoyl-CoA dioxygenase family)